MTRDQFDAAVQTLRSQGLPLSRNAIVRAAGGGSKRHCAAFLQELAAQEERAMEEPATAECPLMQAKDSYTQALEAVAREQAVQPRTKAAVQAHVARLTSVHQTLGQAEARWRDAHLAAREALAQLQYARAARGRGSRARQAQTQAQIDHATTALQQLLATTCDAEALVHLTLDALQEPIVGGKPLVSGLVG